ncbi:hypothetical protein K7640_21110 [Micromonospora sp. PLK6-60]|uniref:hypothetical protein n=1 Tax=Micromonospora sp. PLK6-60 TaxID=2873383 RepID=UPI001CA6F23B|nr:hypothetical protein [Micromonospora sp. PLK6-60]MBY8874335.1 hypothetical protein [Micromonospora sp. PLK6-60]
MRVARRVPEGQPFVVRPRVRRRAARVALLIGALLGGFFLVAGVSRLGGPPAGPRPDGLVIPLAACCLLVAVLFWLANPDDPVLAAGPDGLWIRARVFRGQVVWLPWSEIALVHRHRHGLEPVLCVQPRDRGLFRRLGLLAWLDTQVPGPPGPVRAAHPGFLARLRLTDRAEQEVVAALRRYARGRCPID